MSFALGNIGETLWVKHLAYTHSNLVTAPPTKFYDWDVKGVYQGRDVTYEVKYDAKGYYYADRHKRPVNLYIEYRNTNQNEPSGILASKADYYVYILRSLDKQETAYVFNRLELLHHLQETNYPSKTNRTGGDNNAIGWLPPLEKVKPLVRKKIRL